MHKSGDQHWKKTTYQVLRLELLFESLIYRLAAFWHEVPLAAEHKALRHAIVGLRGHRQVLGSSRKSRRGPAPG